MFKRFFYYFCFFVENKFVHWFGRQRDSNSYRQTKKEIINGDLRPSLRPELYTLMGLLIINIFNEWLPGLFFFWCNFKIKNYRLQRDSIMDRQRKRRECSPLNSRPGSKNIVLRNTNRFNMTYQHFFIKHKL